MAQLAPTRLKVNTRVAVNDLQEQIIREPAYDAAFVDIIMYSFDACRDPSLSP
jgi:hypothetical protein